LADFQNSDFISAENQTVKFDDPTLEFTHRTARVAIDLKPGTGFTSVAGATVSLVSLSADNGNPTAIKTYNASGNTYEALTAPQTVVAGK
ncbi:fimbrillin family protein, partial [Bacteroides caccae]